MCVFIRNDIQHFPQSQLTQNTARDTIKFCSYKNATFPSMTGTDELAFRQILQYTNAKRLVLIKDYWCENLVGLLLLLLFSLLFEKKKFKNKHSHILGIDVITYNRIANIFSNWNIRRVHLSYFSFVEAIFHLSMTKEHCSREPYLA